VPVGGLEVKMKHVLLQPVSETPNKGNPNKNNFQTGLHRARLFLASGSGILHLRTSCSSRRLIFYLRMSREEAKTPRNEVAVARKLASCCVACG
jgi:hypothetical protein